MKTELKAKFIQQILSKKKDSEGFTLIELLVVIIIIGILSAIALPSFLSQAAKAKQTEAKSFVGAVNRAQQAFRMENTTFTTDIAALQIGVPSTSEYYNYLIAPSTSASTALFTAIPIGAETSTLRAYAGGVTILTSGQTATAACMTTTVSGTAPTVNLSNTGASCTSNANNMK
ncbi:MAG: prepilin-type N-terminal cleavage/methylation domain-containing protein [Dolichospermum sp. LBC05a]|nr:type IV pilin-like G/H family protein [Dolichospermum sp. OL01]MCO5797200.1 type IV pilin-like G/H family protein [Dolichospermum sp. OL03]MCS6282060.1 type IV pilin-like G/H family protein [Dolichospermum sp.]QSV58737.1 MAG: prepilin-type N-terminal cleavage/methylation domain-containing protein [Dolichospermum sp. LBC05a]